MLPIDSEFRKYFEGNEENFITCLYDTINTFNNLKPAIEELSLQTSDQVAIEDMASNPLLLRFLQTLVMLKQPNRILEIGTFIGISAIYMAKILPDGGQIVTIEKYEHFADIARRNFTANGLSKKIKLIQGDAFDQLSQLRTEEHFDIIFLDGDKERYLEYFQLLHPLLALNGLLIVDDVLFHGDVLNKIPKSKKGAGVRKFLEHVKNDKGYHKVILPISNGIMLMIKLCE